MSAALLAALFFRAAPLDMPKAEAYLVSSAAGEMRLEDRFDEFELWMGRSILGRWADEQGRVLTVAKLDVAVPLFDGAVMTRAKYVANIAPIHLKDEGMRRDAIDSLSPFPIAEKPSSPKIPVRGMKRVEHFRGTNVSAVVCAFLPEDSRAWYFASWELLEGDDPDEAEKTFEKEFLVPFDEIVPAHLRSETAFLAKKRAYQSKKSFAAEAGGKDKSIKLSERELLREDACRSVTNYPSWHATNAKEFSIIDNLPDGAAFVQSLTNELGTMRALYAKTVPSPLSATNSLAVARIYSSRAEYLAALGENDVEGMEWSAAYWSPARRELVAYLPDGGESELVETLRHEAFHQYLSYATCMIPASPWFNEGYAQYFENVDSTAWGVPADVESIAPALPAIMAMDYGEFYDGTSVERALKYRVAWSIAVFVEKGAPLVHNKPFENLKKDYIAALLKTKDMKQATFAAFDGSQEKLKLFVSEWKKFWKNAM